MALVQHKSQKAGDIAASSLSDALLTHYRAHARALPWRAMPGAARSDAYHVWLSEIMLQQTTVAAVIPYFQKFTAQWADFAALAAADNADVMAAWAGLGYYARARNLLACARAVVRDHGGRLPDEEGALLGLPGIGGYTAAAIASIAFGKRAVVVDANIERVIARLFAIDTPLPAGKAEIRAAMDAITPTEHAGDFAQAMMDLGASLCSVKAPACALCPINGWCAGYASGQAEAYPVKAPKKAKPQRSGMAYWMEREGHVWLVRRRDSGMLGGMRALPDDGWSARTDGNAVAPVEASWHVLEHPVSHVFTHFALSLSVAVTAWPDSDDPPGQGQWWPVNSLDKAGLPTLFKKAAKTALVGRKKS